MLFPCITVEVFTTLRYINLHLLYLLTNRTTGRHLPLWDPTSLPDTSEHVPALKPARNRVLDMPTPEGWKAELTCRLPLPGN